MGDPFETLISGYWGEVVTPLTATCWSWLPSLPVISLRNTPQALPSVIAQLTTCGYEPVESDSLEIVCHYLGAGVLLLIRPDEYIETWASHETKLFAVQYPIVLGVPPLLGGVPRDLMSVPPVEYGKLALYYANPDPSVLGVEQLATEGVEAYTLSLAIREHLTIARERHHDPQMFEALMLLFFGQQSKLITQYGEMAKRRLTTPSPRLRRWSRHRRHLAGFSGQMR